MLVVTGYLVTVLRALCSFVELTVLDGGHKADAWMLDPFVSILQLESSGPGGLDFSSEETIGQLSAAMAAVLNMPQFAAAGDARAAPQAAAAGEAGASTAGEVRAAFGVMSVFLSTMPAAAYCVHA